MVVNPGRPTSAGEVTLRLHEGCERFFLSLFLKSGLFCGTAHLDAMAGAVDLRIPGFIPALFRHDGARPARPRRAMTEQLETQMRLLLVGQFPRCVRRRKAADATRKLEGGLPGIASSLPVMAPPGPARWWPSATEFDTPQIEPHIFTARPSSGQPWWQITHPGRTKSGRLKRLRLG